MYKHFFIVLKSDLSLLTLNTFEVYTNIIYIFTYVFQTLVTVFVYLKSLIYLEL